MQIKKGLVYSMIVASLAGLVMSLVPVLASTKADYSLDIKAIEERITPKTKTIIINTPNSPTGVCYDEASLRALAELSVKHDFYVIVDEIYEKLVYGGNRHISTTFVQWATVEALHACDASVEQMRKVFLARRDYLYEKALRPAGDHLRKARRCLLSDA